MVGWKTNLFITPPHPTTTRNPSPSPELYLQVPSKRYFHPTAFRPNLSQQRSNQRPRCDSFPIGESGGIRPFEPLENRSPLGGIVVSSNPLKVTSAVDLLLLMIDGFLGKLSLMRKLPKKKGGRSFSPISHIFWGEGRGSDFCVWKKVCKKKTNSLCWSFDDPRCFNDSHQSTNSNNKKTSKKTSAKRCLTHL